MNISHQIEPTSTVRLLSCLGLAIEETKLVRSLVKSREMARNIKTSKLFPQRSVCLSREIKGLEARLTQVRSKANSIDYAD